MSSDSTTFSSKPDQVVVVPPMAVAWLTEADCTKMLVSFEARGHSDATVLLSSHRTAGRLSPAVNYTVIIGSHRNSCVKIEKNGVVVCQVQTRGPSAGHVASPASSPTKSRPNELHPMQLDPSVFRAFWVSYGHGEIKVGFRDDRDAFCAWKDAVDVAGGGTSAGSASVNSGKGVENVRHVGLSCWNTHVGYRNVHVKTAVHVRSDMDRDGSDDSDGDHARMSVSVRLALDYLDDDAMERDEEFSSCPPSKIMNVVPLLETCVDTIKHSVTIETVCEYLVGLDLLTNHQHLSSEVFVRTREHCVAFAATHIEALLADHRHQLCALPSCVMEAIVKHQAIPVSEMVVYDVVRCWYRANGPEDKVAEKASEEKGEIERSERPLDVRPDPFSLLRHVRFPLMSGKELEALTMPHTPVTDLMDSPAWHESLAHLVREASEYHRGCKNTSTLHDPSIFIAGVVDDVKMLRLPTDADGPLRFRERSPSGCVHLVYMYDGDNNGVFQFVGTRYGMAPWSNPVAAGLVSISSSSPVGRFCDPRALVGRSFSSLNFAGPRRSVDGGVESWWTVDLKHGLRCTRYAVRHDGSSDYLRSWSFQGSVDGTSWVALDEHTDDATIRMPAQWASWPVRDVRRRTFRYFRILQTAPSNGAPNPMHLSLDHLELYGDLFLRQSHEIHQVT